MVAAPWPVVDASAIHDAFVLADQEHSRSELTVRVPLPPDAGTCDMLFETLTWHLVAVGPTTFVVADDPQPAAITAAHAMVVAIDARRASGSTRDTYRVTIDGRRAEARRHSSLKTPTHMQAAGRQVQRSPMRQLISSWIKISPGGAKIWVAKI
jgi:hypothetical protein